MLEWLRPVVIAAVPFEVRERLLRRVEEIGTGAVPRVLAGYAVPVMEGAVVDRFDDPTAARLAGIALANGEGFSGVHVIHVAPNTVVVLFTLLGLPAIRRLLGDRVHLVGA